MSLSVVMEIGVVRVALFLWLAVCVSCTTNTNTDVTCDDLYMCGVEAVCFSDTQAGNDTCNITKKNNGMVKLHEISGSIIVLCYVKMQIVI